MPCATGYCATVLTICLYFKIVCIAIDVEDRDKTALGNTPGTVRSWSILIIIPSADGMINRVDHDQINSSADGMITVLTMTRRILALLNLTVLF